MFGLIGVKAADVTGKVTLSFIDGKSFDVEYNNIFELHDRQQGRFLRFAVYSDDGSRRDVYTYNVSQLASVRAAERISVRADEREGKRYEKQ